MFLMAVAASSSGDAAIRCVLPVLCMTPRGLYGGMSLPPRRRLCSGNEGANACADPAAS